MRRWRSTSYERLDYIREKGDELKSFAQSKPDHPCIVTESWGKGRIHKIEVPSMDFGVTFGIGTAIHIPGKSFSIYDDDCGPVLRTYVGPNWEADRQRFRNRDFVNAKLYGRPRIYLEYSGRCECKESFNGLEHMHSDRLNPLLNFYGDLRDYAPEGSDPFSYHTSDVIEEFITYFERVLKAIHEPTCEKEIAALTV